MARNLLPRPKKVGGVNLAFAKLDGMNMPALLGVWADDVRSRMAKESVACLAGNDNVRKVSIILYVSKDLHLSKVYSPNAVRMSRRPAEAPAEVAAYGSRLRTGGGKWQRSGKKLLKFSGTSLPPWSVNHDRYFQTLLRGRLNLLTLCAMAGIPANFSPTCCGFPPADKKPVIVWNEHDKALWPSNASIAMPGQSMFTAARMKSSTASAKRMIDDLAALRRASDAIFPAASHWCRKIFV